MSRSMKMDVPHFDGTDPMHRGDFSNRGILQLSQYAGGGSFADCVVSHAGASNGQVSMDEG